SFYQDCCPLVVSAFPKKNYSAPASIAAQIEPTGMFASACGKNINIWDLENTNHPIEVLIGHEADIIQLTIMKDGTIVSSDKNGQIKPWKLQSVAESIPNKSKATIVKASGPVHSAAGPAIVRTPA